jgi:acetylglutamate kinase
VSGVPGLGAAADADAAAPTPVVVKLGGTTIAEEQDVLREIVAERASRPVVVVHGGGKRLTDWLTRLGVESRFDAGRRVTDAATLEVFLAVIGGVINAELTVALRELGADACGVRGIDGGTIGGESVAELGLVITEPVAEPGLLQALLADGRLPVVAPMGLDTSGRICNVNADDVSAALAAALGGELLQLTDTDGVRDAAGARIPELTPSDAERLIAEGIIGGGMVPKVRSALRALGPSTETGVAVHRARRAVIADGRVAGALHRALHEGAGTGFRIS